MASRGERRLPLIHEVFARRLEQIFRDRWRRKRWEGEERRDMLTRLPPSFCVCQGHPPPRGREEEQNQIVLIVVLIPILE